MTLAAGLRDAGRLSAHDAFDAGQTAGRGRGAGVVMLSLLSPGLGHIKAGTWQVGLLLLGIAQVLVLALRGVPHIMVPTPRALLLEAALGCGLFVLVACAAAHAAWLAKRTSVEAETMGRSASTYVPLPLDVRVRQTGPDLSFVDKSGPLLFPWFAAVCLIAGGACGALMLTSNWSTATVPSSGMGPTLAVGDRLLVDVRRAGLAPRRGEIVVLRSHDEDRPFVLRRVIGLAGDRVVLRRRTLMLNGNRLERVLTTAMFEADGVTRPVGLETLPFVDPYEIIPDASPMMDDGARLIVVPPGSVFVMRDDRASPVAMAGSVSGLAPTAEIDGVATMMMGRRSGGLLPRRL